MLSLTIEQVSIRLTLQEHQNCDIRLFELFEEQLLWIQLGFPFLVSRWIGFIKEFFNTTHFKRNT